MGTSAALAQNVFRGMTSTAGGYGTWDSDLINVEAVTQTGAGVYVAVLDTGLVPHWRDYFPEARIATELGAGFHQPVTFKAKNQDPCGLEAEVGQLRSSTWVGSRDSTHGTHVASTILGYFYRANYDALAGFPLPPIMVRGIAPDVTVIPVKVLSDYRVPALPKCGGGQPSFSAVFGTSAMVAAGIRYVTSLKQAGYSPMVINMSLGGPAFEMLEEQAAIDEAIAAGVIVVASAGNDGEYGMGYPGAYAPVISVGSAGWVGEWLDPGADVYYRMWWLKYVAAPMHLQSAVIGEPTNVGRRLRQRLQQPRASRPAARRPRAGIVGSRADPVRLRLQPPALVLPRDRRPRGPQRPHQLLPRRRHVDGLAARRVGGGADAAEESGAGAGGRRVSPEGKRLADSRVWRALDLRPQ